jgi:hypothetical protein
MKKLLVFSLLCCITILSSQTIKAQYSAGDFKPLHLLAGKWKMETKKGFLYEHWYTVNDSTLQNKSYRVTGTDTLPQEKVELKFTRGAITYTSTVADQNNQQPVTFTLVSKENGKYIFENKGHDFPQQISYQLNDANTLNAGISGKINNKYREIPFNYKREQ